MWSGARPPPPAIAATCAGCASTTRSALDRLLYALDRAASAGRGKLVVIHGLGTGALRQAVRAHLAESPYVTRFAPAPPDEGGDGATIAVLN